MGQLSFESKFTGKRPSVSNTLRIIITMPRASRQTAYWVCVAFMAAGLAGCAETSYPSLPNLPSANDSSLLTPSEQEKAIKDLSAERAQASEQQKSSR
jgi:hypothetical protein